MTTSNDPHGHAHRPASGLEELRGRGRRLTRQRALIWQVLTAAPDVHLSAEDVAARVAERLPRVSPSTVYRNLEVLLEEGFVRRTQLGPGRSFYEPAHEHQHHHLVCEHCGDVTHVHSDVFGDLDARLLAGRGFTLGNTEITLFGHCRDCVSGKPD